MTEKTNFVLSNYDTTYLNVYRMSASLLLFKEYNLNRYLQTMQKANWRLVGLIEVLNFYKAIRL